MSGSDDPVRETRMSLGEHLEELRARLLKAFVALAVAFAVAWAWQEELSRFVLRPYARTMAMLQEHFVPEAEAALARNPETPRTEFFLTDAPDDDRLRHFDPRPLQTQAGESFFFVLKICGFAAVLVGSPILFWQLWAFVSAGLYRNERRAFLRYFPLSLGLFGVGVAFGYLVMVPYAMFYTNSILSIELVEPNVTLSSYLSFLSSLCLAFGVVFQLPVLMSFLCASGAVGAAAFARYRGHFIVAAFVLAAMLTPPDPITQLMMGVPMVVLYEVGVVAGRLIERRRRRTAPAEGVA